MVVIIRWNALHLRDGDVPQAQLHSCFHVDSDPGIPDSPDARGGARGLRSCRGRSLVLFTSQRDRYIHTTVAGLFSVGTVHDAESCFDTIPGEWAIPTKIDPATVVLQQR